MRRRRQRRLAQSEVALKAALIERWWELVRSRSDSAELPSRSRQAHRRGPPVSRPHFPRLRISKASSPYSAAAWIDEANSVTGAAAIVSNTTGTYEIYSMNAAGGTSPTQITRGPEAHTASWGVAPGDPEAGVPGMQNVLESRSGRGMKGFPP